MTEPNDPVDPNRLSLIQAAKILSAAANIKISTDRIKADVQSGAPTNKDGSLNLVYYAAWLAKEMGRGK